MKFGIVADDNTGATDAAGMLTERGVRTILIVDWSSKAEAVEMASAFEAVVLSTEARSAAPNVAFRRTAEAVDLLKTIGADKVQVKYSSTFDSTPEGNIGPSLDAATDRLGAPGTIVCPALPVYGRVTFLGYHFVNGLLLSESPMRDHPLNPMTDSNLVRWLQQQTDRRVDVADLYVVRHGPKALRRFLDSRVADGFRYLVTDAIEQRDLAVIAEATREWPLVSGGSGITAEIPAVHFPGRDPLSFAQRLSGREEGAVVVAGSCSPATRRQNAFAARKGFRTFRISGLAVLAHGETGGPFLGLKSPTEAASPAPACEPRGDWYPKGSEPRGDWYPKGSEPLPGVLDKNADLGGIAEQAAAALADGENIILSASAGPEEVAQVQEYGREIGLSVPEVGRRIAAALAEVTAQVLAHGETGGTALAAKPASKAAPPAPVREPRGDWYPKGSEPRGDWYPKGSAPLPGVLARGRVGTLIVSGGETAGAVCRRLGIRSLEVGLPIEPGVPYCFPLDGPQAITVLKSGNFGSEDFYLRVLERLARDGGPV